VTAKGLRGGTNGSVFGIEGESYDTLGQIVAGAKRGAGASYGGVGGNGEAVTGLPYGLLEAAVYLGAGGGGTDSRPGGHGWGSGNDHGWVGDCKWGNPGEWW